MYGHVIRERDASTRVFLLGRGVIPMGPPLIYRHFESLSVVGPLVLLHVYQLASSAALL